MRKLKCGALALLWPVMSCFAQNAPPQIKPLTIGDTVPDLVLTNVINYPVSEIRLSDLKGKLVILDFWSSWCGSCISLFPHLQQLQEQFKDSIQIILANTKSHLSKDSAPKILGIFGKVKQRTGKAITLPATYDNPFLDQYFPCINIPHEVLIGKDGIVKAITAADEMTASNVGALLRNKQTSMHFKKDIAGFNSNEPLFLKGNGGDGAETIHRSLLTGYVEGIGTMTGMRMKSGKVAGGYAFNVSLFHLIRNAFKDLASYPNNRIRIVSTNPYFDMQDDALQRYQHLYCYDLILAPTNEKEMRIAMQEDMKRYFNIKIYPQKRKIKCLVITANNTSISRAEAMDPKPGVDLEKQSIHKYINHYPASSIASLLNRYSNIPIVNELKNEYQWSIDLPKDINDTAALTAAFAKAGLTLQELCREVDLMIITDESTNEERLPANP